MIQYLIDINMNHKFLKHCLNIIYLLFRLNNPELKTLFDEDNLKILLVRLCILLYHC